jgi:hypothetical protein
MWFAVAFCDMLPPACWHTTIQTVQHALLVVVRLCDTGWLCFRLAGSSMPRDAKCVNGGKHITADPVVMCMYHIGWGSELG